MALLLCNSVPQLKFVPIYLLRTCLFIDNVKFTYVIILFAVTMTDVTITVASGRDD